MLCYLIFVANNGARNILRKIKIPEGSTISQLMTAPEFIRVGMDYKANYYAKKTGAPPDRPYCLSLLTPENFKSEPECWCHAISNCKQLSLEPKF